VRTDDFDYDLPDEQIARYPTARRDGSRLLVVEAERRRDLRFSELAEVLSGDELLVVNDTRVLHARVRGRRLPGGGRVELLMVRPDDGAGGWLALGRTSRPMRAGHRLALPGDVEAEVTGRSDDGLLRLMLTGCDDVVRWLEAHGEVPLPPYLRRDAEPEDGERYQTVYAASDGAVAAPTAGLHFTSELLGALRDKGCDVAPLTLHVGPGTFSPVRVDDPRQHALDAEHYEVPPPTALALAAAMAAGRPILAGGTRVVRALEHAAAADGSVHAGPGLADLLVLPGYRFAVVDRLLTNFHLPRSSLLMLVAALAGTDRTLSAYREAVAAGYRFYSYGDATLWL